MLVSTAIALAAAGLAFAQSRPAGTREDAVRQALSSSFASATPEWRVRLVQDDTQKACSRYRNAPPKSIADRIMARARAGIEYPPDGKLMGDWKKGEALAQSGYGGRYSDVPPRAENGGNCYACHQLDGREMSFGTLGPPLTGYGTLHGFRPQEVKAVYERIFDPNAVIACARMPRLGASKFLTIRQIQDLVAYVMAPESPVNK
jgi:sulfur-oxidizing protein SoxX